MMKILSLILVCALILVVPSVASAISMGASATVSSGRALGPHVLLKCTGYSFNPATDPWAQCTNQGTATTLDFGTLDTRLRDSGGNDIGGAGCFYAPYFYIVYLFPDTWGALGYQLTQTGTVDAAILNALVFTPVYSDQDKYSGGAAQGALDPNAPNSEVLGTSALATGSHMIFKSKRARIVRSEYGIPPYSNTGGGTGGRPAGWAAIPLSTTGGSYAATIDITIGAY